MLEAKSTTLNNLSIGIDQDLLEWKNIVYNKDILEKYNPVEDFFIVGYAANWKLEHVIDNEADLICKGAFREIVEQVNSGKLSLKMLYQHKKDENPLGAIIALKEDDIGLKYLAFCSKSGVGEDVLSKIKLQQKLGQAEDLLSASFEFAVAESEIENKNNIKIRHIQKMATVTEISIVTYPRNKNSKILFAKSAVLSETFDELTKVDQKQQDTPEGKSDNKMCSTARIRKALVKAEAISAKEANILIKDYMTNKYSEFCKKQEPTILLLKNEIESLKSMNNNLLNEIIELKQKKDLQFKNDDYLIDYLFEKKEKNTILSADIVDELGLL